MTNQELVYRIVSSIPLGKISTYGQVAQLTGINNPRVVGNILHRNPDPKTVPCHRVVNFRGQVAQNYAFGGATAQVEKLRTEGIPIKSNKILDLANYLWKPPKTIHDQFSSKT